MASGRPTPPLAPKWTHSESDILATTHHRDDDYRRGHPLVMKTSSYPGKQRSSYNDMAKKQWKAAALKTRKLLDPWAGHRLDEISEEVATRHMYDPHTGRWQRDEVVVKIQSEPFAHGAMRECFRMKKLSKFSQHPDWSNASNYVAKRYMKEVPREVYFEDVKLQLDAKLWGEVYSSHNPPKKVDFFQTYIIELQKREGSPLYCVEHLIEGKYIKYNSNSGFVSEVNRLTPQAFSHFTFERSNHHCIVVDIQGVGDLYTDPQIHTVGHEEYGDANLGTRGMALFFSSHICSPLCETLGLTQFDLSQEEMDRLRSKRWNFSSATTFIPLSKSEPVMPAHHGNGKDTVQEAFRRLSLATNRTQAMRNLNLRSDLSSSASIAIPESPLDSPGITMAVLSPMSQDSGQPSLCEGVEREEGGDCVDGKGSDCMESGADSRNSVTKSTEGGVYLTPSPFSSDGYEQSLLSASVDKEVTRSREEEGSGGGGGRGEKEKDSLRILGLVHLDLARYHEMGRFSEDQTPDLMSAEFHLKKAASCGNVGALHTLACIHLQRPHEEFKEIVVEPSPAHECAGMDYLVQAAEGGLRVAMVEVGRAYNTGQGLGKAPEELEDPSFPAKQRSQNWIEAVAWYRKFLDTPSDSESDASCCSQTDPDYTILSCLAEMYRSGGHGLESDCRKAGDLYTQAAEAAMAAMKGKLANKLYMLAEEAWAEAPEED